MGKSCVVCKSYFKSDVNRSFHRIPGNFERRRLWLFRILKYLEKQNIPKYSVVCSDHFSSCDFLIKPSGRLYLKDSAVPKFPCDSEHNIQVCTQPSTSSSSGTSSTDTFSKEEPACSVMNKPKSYNRGSGKTYCRFCLQPCAKNTTTPLSDVNFNYPGKNYVFKQKKMEKMKETNKMLKFCLPFYDSLTFNPVMCSICLGKLKVAYEFSQMCCKSQQLIEKYAETYSATERVINLNEMLETKVKSNDDETMSGTETFSHIPQVTTTSQKRKYPNDNDSPRKKQKAYSETYEDDSTNSSDNTSNIKIEPDDDALTEYLKIEPDDEDNGCGFMERLTDDVPHKINEEEIKVEPNYIDPNYIDCPDFIKREQVDLHEEHKVFDERTGIGTDIERQHLYHQGPGNVSVDAHNVPLLVKIPTFSNG